MYAAREIASPRPPAVTAFVFGPSRLRIRVDELGQCRPPGWRGPHGHESFVICYFPHAGGWHELDGVRHSVCAGDVLAIPPRLPHDFSDDGSTAAVVISFMADGVSPRLLGDPLLVGDARWGTRRPRGGHPGEGRRLSVPPQERAQFHGRIASLRGELRDQQVGYQSAARAQLALILVSTPRLASPTPPEPAIDPVLEDVFELIEARFRGPLSLAEIASAAARSPRHLSRTVRELTGGSVMQLVEDRRMEEARRLLLETAEKVEVIAHEVGFLDDGYFRRRFVRAHGVPPSTWRRLNR
jgi:AraC family transcriptional activator of pobA